MTTVAQCPQCSTRFRVVPDQLKISHGWVRCGKCAEVFNAREALDAVAALKAGQPAPPHSGPAPQQVSIVLRQQELALPPGTFDTPASPPAPETPAALEAPAAPPPPAADAAWPPAAVPAQAVSPPLPEPATPPAASDAHTHLPAWLIKPKWAPEPPTPAPPETPTATPTAPTFDAPVAAPAQAVQRAAVSALQQTVAEWVRADAQAANGNADADTAPDVNADANADADAAPAEVAAAVPAVDIQIDLPVDALTDPVSVTDATPAQASGLAPEPSLAATAPPATDVGFIRQARRQAAWRSGPVRAALVALVICASALLALQVTVHERNRLAAMAPALKPWLTQVCEPIGCSVVPFEHIEAVEIVSTELVRAKDGGYRFDIGLRNQAGLPVATPAVELSLTDRHNEAVVRRVILPDDWADAPTALPPSSETSLTLRMMLVNPDGLRTEGFRAVVFYP